MGTQTQKLKDAPNPPPAKPSIEDLFVDSQISPTRASSLEEYSKSTEILADGAPISDTEKKIRRAQRFGVLVQLSEEEKRSSRAERFGTRPTSHGSDASKTLEEHKRKSRAERFGLPVPVVPADEEAKKKARLARFSSSPKADPIEEEKRKAREARFSVPTSTSVSKDELEGNIEQAHSIVGKAGGRV